MVSIVKQLSKALPPPGTQPAWDIARLFPDQGCWDEWDYLALDTNQLVEFTDGYVEVLRMPSPAHQRIVKALFVKFLSYTSDRQWGEVLFAPLRVRLRERQFREPDLVLMSNERSDRKAEKYWGVPDLAVEVVSDDPESHERDYVQKVEDYAAAGVTEYWIVDPQEKRIRVLRLDGKAYAVHGEFLPGQVATSALLNGFAVDVTAIFAAANGP